MAMTIRQTGRLCAVVIDGRLVNSNLPFDPCTGRPTAAPAATTDCTTRQTATPADGNLVKVGVVLVAGMRVAGSVVFPGQIWPSLSRPPFSVGSTSLRWRVLRSPVVEGQGFGISSSGRLQPQTQRSGLYGHLRRVPAGNRSPWVVGKAYSRHSRRGS